MKPGWMVSDVTKAFTAAFTARGYGEVWIPGPVHGIGLEFEEWPHPSHYFNHLQLRIRKNWILAVEHSI